MSHEGKLGARKLRKAAVVVGEPLFMAFAWHPEVECVTPDDRHLFWNRQTNIVEERIVAHYNTCPKLNG